jgi:hypothetical protein
MTLIGNTIQFAGVVLALLGIFLYKLQTSGVPWLAFIFIFFGVIAVAAISIRRELMVHKGAPSAAFRLVDLLQAIVGLPFTYLTGYMLTCELLGSCTNNDISGALILIVLVPFWLIVSLVAVPLRVPALVRLGGKGIPGLILYALFALVPALVFVHAMLS